jgi:hypothetical protein
LARSRERIARSRASRSFARLLLSGRSDVRETDYYKSAKYSPDHMIDEEVSESIISLPLLAGGD